MPTDLSGFPALIEQIRTGSCVQQRPYGSLVAAQAREIQRRPAVVVLDVWVRGHLAGSRGGSSGPFLLFRRRGAVLPCRGSTFNAYKPSVRW